MRLLSHLLPASFVIDSMTADFRRRLGMGFKQFACLALFFVPLAGCSSSSDRETIEESTQEEVVPDRATQTDTTNQAQPAERPSNGADSRTIEKASTQASRETRLAEAKRLLAAGQTEQAKSVLREQLLTDPDDVEVIFLLAQAEASAGNLDQAIEFLGSIAEDHPEAGLPALGQAADWCMQLERYDDAEKRYLAILRLIPDAAPAHRRLAQLLNRQGRRHEASFHLRELCKQGNIRQDELHALIVVSDAMVSEPGEATSPELDYTPIGPGGEGRKLFTEERYPEAVDALREHIASGDAKPATVALYGRLLAEAQSDDEFVQWLGSINDEVKEYPEYWSAMGVFLASRRQHSESVRALLEALNRDSTDFRSMNRIHHMLKLVDQPELVKLWEKRWNAYRDVVVSNNKVSAAETPDAAAMEKLGNQLMQLGRELEGVMWKSLATYHRGLPAQALQPWNERRKELVATGNSFPDQAMRICGMKFEDYPLPDVSEFASRTKATSGSPIKDTGSLAPAAFTDIASQVGITHTYEASAKKLATGFAMHNQTGGGVTVIDFDLDGQPDLYFAQGACDAPDFISTQSNHLLRKVDSAYRNVTNDATATDQRYTIGCTTGDWNQDGFPDLISSNIGMSLLWINNGDGSFTAHDIPGSDEMQRMPSSIAIADLDGDNLPDIYEGNYMQSDEMGRLPKRNASGRVIEAEGPGGFPAFQDRIAINDGSGGIKPEFLGPPDEEKHHALGIVIADFDGRPGNDLFVGNDKSANQLWVRDEESGEWTDVAMLKGTAFSFGGAGTASMGIASGDFDRSGTLDIHITNFQNEPACLFLRRGDIFEDRAVQFRLGPPSQAVLGFGTQAIDYDNNGFLDLVVTNGHIDDYQNMSGPFRQKAQLFANRGNRFEEVAVDDPSGYWGNVHLGRALARLDFDQDGRMDYVVTHIEEPSALLRNETPSNGHWAQLVLVGTQSERDAIGARVTVRAGEQQWTDWITGGDGYLCRNERLLPFGLGDQNRIDEIIVEWPSGQSQTWTSVPVDQRCMLIEGEPESFELSR
jgi:tetratricopeptide (TPR) repeat protein